MKEEPEMLLNFAPKRPPKVTYSRSLTAERVTEDVWLKGKTALVTGANSGLGFETTRVLSMRGAHVIAACRSSEQAERTCEVIAGRTTPLTCNLADLSSVAHAVTQIEALDRPVDILICNAGMMSFRRDQPRNGIEPHLLTNHFGHFALVQGLMPLIERAEQGRIVIVASEAHRQAPKQGIKFDDLKFERNYSPMRAYAQSKLANLLFMKELARRVAGTSVTVNAVHPGVVQTQISRHAPPVIDGLTQRFGHFVMRTPAQGAATQCYVATSERLRRVNGYYFANCNAKRPSSLARNQDLAEQLWNISENFLEQSMARQSS